MLTDGTDPATSSLDDTIRLEDQQNMTQPALKTDPRTPTLTVVAPTAAQRLRAKQDSIRAEARESLEALLEQMRTLAIEARDLSTIDTYGESEQQALKQFAANTEGSLRMFGRG